jgi:ferrous iron transport protein B
MTRYRIALAGNPNSGKTTVFNLLVGAQERIGNWPGTTVEQKEGLMEYRGQEFTVVDLPGTYSLSARSIDERIARDFLAQEKPDVIVAVLDASNLQRSLFLVVQLLEMGQNLVVALNMMDLAKQASWEIDSQTLSELLRVPVVECVASKGQGINRIQEMTLANIEKNVSRLHVDYGPFEKDVDLLEEFFQKKDFSLGFGYRALAVKALEGDEIFLQEIQRQGYLTEITETINRIQRHGVADIETRIIEQKFAFIKGIIKECVRRHLTFEERLTISDKIDLVVTNRFIGIPLFLGFMYGLFTLVFKVGSPLVNLLEQFFAFIGARAEGLVAVWGWPKWIGSLLSDGIISGVGSVLVFLPYIALLYLGISFLQDSGYLARSAFIMDRFMHKLGLHGKSFIPMLLGFGCSIPGVMATRTLESNKDRILTILVLPLMSCAARLPVYTLFAGALFPKHAGAVVFSLYVLGIVMAILMAQVFKNIFFQKETSHLVMELPPYRWPHLRSVTWQMWFQALMFIRKAGTVIFCFVLLTWVLASFPLGVEYASEKSVIGHIGKFISPIFRPAGFGFWQAAVALFFGIMAKEVVVGILGTLYGVEGDALAAILQKEFSPAAGYAFLIMVALYIPCIATIAVIRKETNWKWAGLAVAYTFLLGWVCSVIVYQTGRLLIK